MKKLEYKFVSMAHKGDYSEAGWGAKAQRDCNTHTKDGYVIVNHIPTGNTVMIIMAREMAEAQ